jgi:hypothetical protein
MDSDLTKAMANGIVRLTLDWPMAILMIRLWVWGGVFEATRLPVPTIRQTVGISGLIVLLST